MRFGVGCDSICDVHNTTLTISLLLPIYRSHNTRQSGIQTKLFETGIRQQQVFLNQYQKSSAAQHRITRCECHATQMLPHINTSMQHGKSLEQSWQQAIVCSFVPQSPHPLWLLVTRYVMPVLICTSVIYTPVGMALMQQAASRGSRFVQHLKWTHALLCNSCNHNEKVPLSRNVRMHAWETHLRKHFRSLTWYACFGATQREDIGTGRNGMMLTVKLSG